MQHRQSDVCCREQFDKPGLTPLGIKEIFEKQSTAELEQVLPEVLHQASNRMTNPAFTDSLFARNRLSSL
jgi:hypothetical protein